MLFFRLKFDMNQIQIAEKHGYTHVKLLPCGATGIHKFMYTTAIVTGIDDDGYYGRYCYKTLEQAVEALNQYSGIGDPSGPWIAYKGHGGERFGPGLCEKNVK